MKKVTKKQRLVDYMIAAGNPGFTYTQVIETLLKFRFGDDFKYDRKYRGYYSCAISGYNNHLMNGSGKCGLEKRDGLYYGKYFTAPERMWRARRMMMQHIDYCVGSASYYKNTREQVIPQRVNDLTAKYLRSIKRIEKETASQPSSY